MTSQTNGRCGCVGRLHDMYTVWSVSSRAVWFYEANWLRNLCGYGSAVTETHTALPLYTRTCTDNPSSTYHSIQHRILTKETPKDVRCLFCVNQRILFMNFTDYIPNKYINSTLNNHAHLRISVSVQLYVS